MDVFPEMSALMAQRMTYVVDVRNIYSQPRSPPRGCVAFAQESPLPSFLSSRGSIMTSGRPGGLVAARSPEASDPSGGCPGATPVLWPTTM